MAYPLLNGDIIEVTYRGLLFNQVCMNVLHFRANVIAPIPDGNAALQTLLTALAGNNATRDRLTQCMAPEAVLTEQRAQVVYPTRRYYTSNNLNIPGTANGACTASNISGVIQLRADQAGKGRQGYVHIFGGPTNQTTGGSWNVLYLANLSNLGDQLLLTRSFGFGLGEAIPTIWSRVKPNNPSGLAGFFVHTTVRTMHRRTVGLGI